MNKIIKYVVIMSAVSSAGLWARGDFRSPLSVTEGMMHGSLPRVSSMWWYDAMAENHKENKWCLDFWAAGFHRTADKSFLDACATPKTKCPTDDDDGTSCTISNKNTTKTVSLSTLFFGKETFRGEEAFADGIITNPTNADGTITNPVLNLQTAPLGFSRISPRFDYTESGVVLGFCGKRRFGSNDQWGMGFRVSVPFKTIELEQDTTVQLAETLDEIAQVRRNDFDDDESLSFSIRLDVLSSLILPLGTDIPMVSFGDLANRTRIVVNVDRPANANMGESIYLIRRTDGTAPTNLVLGFVAPDGTSAQGVTQLNADGSGGRVNFFRQGTDYRSNIGADRAAQGQLFVVPRIDGNGLLQGDSSSISDMLEQIFTFNVVPQTSLDFFANKGIDFNANRHISGIGDIDLDWCFSYGYEGDWFVDYVLGVRVPTGKKQDKGNDPYFISTGNNGHWEAKLGLEGGWQPYHWFGFRLDASYHHAFSRHENLPTPFKGATVKNIGSTTEGDVSWNYFIARVNFDFMHPQNPELGCVLGYEFFGKLKDDVSLDCTTATDLLGRVRDLDGKILECGTKSMTHKIRGEIFHRWNFFELFVGASRVIAGRHAMQESEAHLGVAVYF